MLVQASSDMTWIDVQFLKDAVDMLIECRRVLKFTYVYGFYLPHDTAKRELFEDHQVCRACEPPAFAQRPRDWRTIHTGELGEVYGAPERA